MTNKTLTSCLGDLGITDAAFFDSCDSADDEFKLIKKSWRTRVLAEHPVNILVVTLLVVTLTVIDEDNLSPHVLYYHSSH